MEENTPIGFVKPGTISDPLTELLRMGARKLIEAAIQAELAEFLQQFETRKTSQGKRGVIRNGYQPEREILTGIGAVSIRIPKVRSRTGEPVTFRSALVPPYIRKRQSLEAALPWLYLKGISTGEMQDALSALVGPEAKFNLNPQILQKSLKDGSYPTRLYGIPSSRCVIVKHLHCIEGIIVEIVPNKRKLL